MDLARRFATALDGVRGLRLPLTAFALSLLTVAIGLNSLMRAREAVNALTTAQPLDPAALESIETALWVEFLALIGIAVALAACGLWAHREFKRREALIERSEASLRDIVDFRQHFLGNMSHDLRTPLNAISGFAQLLRIQPDIAVDQRDRYLDNITRSVDKLCDIVNDVLDLSKLNTGKAVLDCAPIPVQELLTDTALRFQTVAAEKSIAVTVSSAEKAELECDELALRRVLDHVMRNALDHSEAGDSITLSAFRRTSAQGDVYVVSIADTGVGIETHELRSITLAYVRESRRRGGKQGAGLGLAVTKSLIEAHGGFVELYSKRGLGTAVRLCFPVSRLKPEGTGSSSHADDQAMTA